MTLLMTVNGPETVWLMADRRITKRGAVVRDNARKVMLLETTDGVAILGYTGLGATRSGTEPADWMSAVLRGRNAPLEHCLGMLADAAKRELPSHLFGTPHSIVATAFLGGEAKVYTIDLHAPPGRPMAFRYTRHVINQPSHIAPRTPPLAYGGSGARLLIGDNRWRRELLRLVRACDRGKVSPHAVADRLAGINIQVHQAEPTVGPRCVVVWRHRKQGVHKGGGAHQFYNGAMREHDGLDGSLPTIANGGDISALLRAIMPQMMEQMEALRAGKTMDLDKDKMNAELAKLPDTPDERLR
jgi:hypothetical protein